ncbi:MAG: hypothetical protein LUD14_08575 [Clostridiales bacterium]|nr:hypothetical protein [Clostridiales bacterium]
MSNGEKRYPNLKWAQFDVCNDDTTGAFEDMARRLFSSEFLDSKAIPHSNPNNPGVEVLPILEAPHPDGSKQRRISFQAKYFDKSVDYSQIKKSMRQAIKHYRNKFDVIYLFCNKTLTTTSKGYKDTEALLKQSGIELCPISNVELLDMVSRHMDIANYFFQPRIRPDEDQFNRMHTNVVVNVENEGCISCPMKSNGQNVNPRILQSFVQEKICVYKNFILRLQLDKLREELNKIFTYNITGFDGADTLLFYQYLMDLHDGKEIDASVYGLSEQYKREVSWLEQYFKNPVAISAYTYASHCVESQTLILDKMFTSQLWDAVISLCNEIMNDDSLEIADIVKQYYGLAAYNLQKYSTAADMFKELYEKNHQGNILLYLTFSEMRDISLEWCDGHYERKDRLVELVNQLDSLKENKQYKSNNRLVAMLYLEAAYNLGINEKEYLEEGIERYQGFPQKVREDPTVKYLYALCLGLNGSIEAAETIYAELDWKDDANIACRYLICKLSRNQYAEALDLYRGINQSVINVDLKSLYLTALYYEERDRYEDVLKEFLNEIRDDFEGIIDIACGIHDRDYLQEYVIPVIKKSVSDEIKKLSIVKKTELLSVLSHAGELELLLAALKTVPEMSTLNRTVIREIYEATFCVSNSEYNNHDKALVRSGKLDASE